MDGWVDRCGWTDGWHDERVPTIDYGWVDFPSSEPTDPKIASLNGLKIAMGRHHVHGLRRGADGGDSVSWTVRGLCGLCGLCGQAEKRQRPYYFQFPAQKQDRGCQPDSKDALTNDETQRSCRTSHVTRAPQPGNQQTAKQTRPPTKPPPDSQSKRRNKKDCKGSIMRGFLVAVAAALGVSVASAAGVPEGVDPFTGLRLPHPEVSAAALVVDRQISAVEGAQFALPLGKPVTVLCGVVNQGVDPITVHFIDGSVNSLDDFRQVYENLTVTDLAVQVEPNDEYTFEYVVTSEEDREDVEGTLALKVVYSDRSNQYYTDTFFNTSVIYVNESDIGASTIITYVALVVVLGLVAAFLASVFMGVGARPVEMGTQGGMRNQGAAQGWTFNDPTTTYGKKGRK